MAEGRGGVGCCGPGEKKEGGALPRGRKRREEESKGRLGKLLQENYSGGGDGKGKKKKIQTNHVPHGKKKKKKFFFSCFGEGKRLVVGSGKKKKRGPNHARTGKCPSGV